MGVRQMSETGMQERIRLFERGERTPRGAKQEFPKYLMRCGGHERFLSLTDAAQALGEFAGTMLEADFSVRAATPEERRRCAGNATTN